MPSLQQKSTVHLIILHGWAIEPNLKRKWVPLLETLKKQNIVTYFLPLPGLGKELKKAWDLNDYAKWLREEVEKVSKKLDENDKLILLGHSFGGQVCARYSSIQEGKPQNAIDKLILVDSSGLRNHDAWSRFIRAGFKQVAQFGKRIIPPEKKMHKGMKKILYKVAREKDYYQASAIQKQIIANIIEDEVWDDLPKIETPTLIIWGGQDLITPIHLAKTFEEKIPNNTLVIIPEARHSAVYTHVKEISKIIVKFAK